MQVFNVNKISQQDIQRYKLFQNPLKLSTKQRFRKLYSIDNKAAAEDIISLMTIQELEERLQMYTYVQEYTKAAGIRDIIKEIRLKDEPTYGLSLQLQEAIKYEDYQIAQKLKQELLLLDPYFFKPKYMGAPHLSVQVTNQILIQARSYYLKDESHPQFNSYGFGYQILIVNQGSRTVKLLSRYWEAVDQSDYKQVIRGPGVVGEKPVLKPGDCFKYDSSLLTSAKQGYMKGSFTFGVMSKEPDEQNVIQYEQECIVGPFALLYEGQEEEQKK